MTILPLKWNLHLFHTWFHNAIDVCYPWTSIVMNINSNWNQNLYFQSIFMVNCIWSVTSRKLLCPGAAFGWLLTSLLWIFSIAWWRWTILYAHRKIKCMYACHLEILFIDLTFLIWQLLGVYKQPYMYMIFITSTI